jgi:hypothetical protein
MPFYIFWVSVRLGIFSLATEATWKPEYDKNPPAVRRWFKEARVAGGCDSSPQAKAWHRLGICGCC